MRFKIRDRVVHKDYPSIKGTVVDRRPSLGFLLVAWDSRPDPQGGPPLYLPPSRHIDSALMPAE